MKQYAEALKTCARTMTKHIVGPVTKVCYWQHKMSVSLMQSIVDYYVSLIAVGSIIEHVTVRQCSTDQ